MISAAFTDGYKSGRVSEYIRFAEHLGTEIRFSEDKWICDKLRRSPADATCNITLYFSGISEEHREMVKYFSVIRLINGNSIGAVKANVVSLSLTGGTRKSA